MVSFAASQVAIRVVLFGITFYVLANALVKVLSSLPGSASLFSLFFFFFRFFYVELKTLFSCYSLFRCIKKEQKK